MDNASIHHGEEVEELFERHGIFWLHTYSFTANTQLCDQVFILFTSPLTPLISIQSKRHSPRSSTICDAIVTTTLWLRARVSFMTCGRFLRSSLLQMQKAIFSMPATFDELHYHHILRYNIVIIGVIYVQAFETLCEHKVKNTTKGFECLMRASTSDH